MTRRLNRNIANDADTTIMRALVQLIGAAATQVLNAFACIAPALASNPTRGSADETGRHAAGAA
ncbi:hypothetical protein WS87_22700 [Burkholderia sp. MSMB0856]|uniref:hypothetical protein n=1 Tax=Burkholderia sp. MSMB0856 TaxID=1637869 RepID=UPI00075DFC85|nr:hypothetical protein [Burkholderia sp. MSMB0856]AOJ89492.1 hypothetical protein WS87_22700 [Burkholderia sp. MSMB0856]KVH34353.1 hypothetical protein WS87_19020 [Burkholderia sp. MSMB0856]